MAGQGRGASSSLSASCPCGTNATLLQTDFQCCKRTSVHAVWSAWMHSLSSIPKPICVVSTYGRSSARHSSWFPLHASCTASKATFLLSVSGLSFSSPARTAVVSPFLAASTKTSSAESSLLFGGFSSGVLSACRFDMVCEDVDIQCCVFYAVYFCGGCEVSGGCP